MSKNYLTLQLGGTQFGLKFNLRLMDFIGELTGEDPLKCMPKSQEWKDLLGYAKTLIHAAMLTNAAAKKEPLNVTKEQLDEWISDLTMEDIILVSNAYNLFINPKISTATNGEGGGDTQRIAASILGGD